MRWACRHSVDCIIHAHCCDAGMRCGWDAALDETIVYHYKRCLSCLSLNNLSPSFSHLICHLVCLTSYVCLAFLFSHFHCSTITTTTKIQNSKIKLRNFKGHSREVFYVRKVWLTRKVWKYLHYDMKIIQISVSDSFKKKCNHSLKEQAHKSHYSFSNQATLVLLYDYYNQTAKSHLQFEIYKC